MGFLALAAFLSLAFFSLAHPFAFNYTRQEIITHYQSKIEPQVPKSARMLIGDEKVNVEIGGKAIGAEFQKGELVYLEMGRLANPGIEISVSDYAAEEIQQGRSGVIPMLDRGEIKVKANSFLAALKVEAAKRIYAISGADEKITGSKKKEPPQKTAAQKARIRG
ncbi:MAG: hypothetical protein N3F07_02980 [Candidatus Micrarchaeota archaeon]|nr:hypothetical protein [Candidatus Micrarchaeota archaeon]